MKAREFITCLDLLKMEPDDLAAFLEVTPRTVRRWTDNDHVPAAEAYLLRLMCYHGHDTKFVLSLHMEIRKSHDQDA